MKTQRQQNAASETALPERVRQDAAWVMGQAEFVTVNTDALAGYTEKMLAQYPVITALDPEHHFLSQASPAATAAYVLALDSVNFGSGYFADAAEAGLTFDYEHVAGALKKCFAESRMNTPEKWAAATPADCREIFGVPHRLSSRMDELMGLFAIHLQVTGQRVQAEFGGSVMNMLEEAGSSAARLAEILSRFPTFADASSYKGRDVGFYKRAQIVAADMFLAFGGKSPAAFTDMQALTSFADNQVPHVLRCDGIIDYAPALARTIDEGMMIAAGGPEETEIRAAGIHAVELMQKTALKAGHKVTAVNIDHILWNRGNEKPFAKKRPHRAITVWY